MELLLVDAKLISVVDVVSLTVEVVTLKAVLIVHMDSRKQMILL